MKMANMDDYFDVVIVGTGAAGLYCALNLPARYRILLLTKQKADESDSFLAQGGICMQHGEQNGTDNYVYKTKIINGIPLFRNQIVLRSFKVTYCMKSWRRNSSAYPLQHGCVAITQFGHSHHS